MLRLQQCLIMFLNDKYHHLKHSTHVQHKRERHPDQHFFCFERRANVCLDRESYAEDSETESLQELD